MITKFMRVKMKDHEGPTGIVLGLIQTPIPEPMLAKIYWGISDKQVYNSVVSVDLLEQAPEPVTGKHPLEEIVVAG